MKACLFLANFEPMVVEDITLDAPGPGQVRVRWVASGVCHSDLSIWQGKLPLPPGCILGHEGAGIVEEVGDGVTGFTAGDHVIGSFVPVCGDCYYCRNGQSFVCENSQQIGMSCMPFHRADGQMLYGGVGGLATFSEQTVCSPAALVKIPEDFPLEQACLVGCGVTTGVGAALNAAGVTKGSTVAVIGCGGVGQSVIQGARIAGAENIIAIDLNEAKRASAAKFGATHSVDPSVKDPTGFVQGLTGGRGADYVFEVVGAPSLQRQAYDMTRPGGKCVWVGVPSMMEETSVPGAMIALQAKQIIGTMYGNANVREDFVKFVQFAKDGELNLADMVSQRISINDINDAFKAMEEGDVVRSVVIHGS
jgi:S-(hydroxymethyl)glutathione dehydrogenase/alcohol dehydrogenase